MKKVIYSLGAFILLISSANANTVASGTAQNVATNYYKQNAHRQVANVTLAYTETSTSGDPVYYVFNMNGTEGFVIVSAEDAGRPIIGYSTEGNFTASSETNPEFNFWMQKRKSEILAIRANNSQATSDISTEWTNYATGKINSLQTLSTATGPLVQSTWNQSGGGTVPYNADCPGGSVTGCVATAMAQIMRYWGYPAQGNSSSSYSAGTYGTLSANYASTTYNWADMPLTYSNADVALISYQAGVSVQMSYSPTESGSYVCGGKPSALYSYPNYFKYNSSTIKCNMMNSYTTAAWITMLEAEFTAGRPVQYEGTDPTNGGHSWVCDGNDVNDNMHMNWGWAGNSNGYYAVTNLVPTGQPFDFSTSIGGIFGIKPQTPTTSLDAGTFALSSPNTICSPVIFTPQVTIKNFGASTLTSCTIIYNLDGGTAQTYPWTGSLTSFASELITLPTMTVSAAGAHVFTCATSMPNGSTDGNTSNDQLQTTFNVISNTASQQAPYVQGFESIGFPYTDCYIASQSGPKWTQVSTAASSGSSSMELQNFGVTTGDVDEFITPSIDMSTVTSPTMTFKLAHAQLSSTDVDQLLIFTSINCGNTWTQRYSKSGSTLANAGVVTSAFTPSSTQWRQETVPISNVGSQTDTRFKFQFTSNGAGNNIYIDDINITGTTATGIAEEYKNGFNLTVFPNPLNDNATISFNILESSNVSLSVYDIVGKEIIPLAAKTELSVGTYTLPLNRNTLKSGIYFVKLNVNGYSVTKKIIVQ